MKKHIKNIKNLSATCGIICVMIGGCMADNENLLPTFLFVTLGAVMVLIHKRIEKSEGEEI